MEHGGLRACRGTVLLIGSRGFIGEYVAAGLRQSGYRVLRGVRSPSAESGDERRCDLATMMDPNDWRAALAGVGVVVNAAGILRETAAQTFEKVHVSGPLALANACIKNRVERFVQISALGDPCDGEFIASKHRFDVGLLALPLNAVVLRPSVVFAAEGSYGGSSLLRALSALPFGIWVPGDGHWQLQPLVAQDLAEIVVRAIESDAAGIFEIGSPDCVSLREYQLQWRRWLRIPGTRVVKVPELIVSLLVWITERTGRGPMGATMWRMLRRGNVTASDAPGRLVEAFGIVPRALNEVLALRPSQVQDRWHARLYFLAPLLRVTLIVLWVLSAISGFVAPANEIEAVAGSQLPTATAFHLARAGAGVDLAFALWLASGWRTRWALIGMAVCVLLYTVVFSLWTPVAWLAPLGGLAKNLVVLAAIAVLWVLSDRR